VQEITLQNKFCESPPAKAAEKIPFRPICSKTIGIFVRRQKVYGKPFFSAIFVRI